MRLLLTGLIFAVGSASSASASDQRIFTYDALGRLVMVEELNGTDEPVVTRIEFDPAGNRTIYNVSGSVTSPPAGGAEGDNGKTLYVIVPLNGFTVIPIPPPQSR